MHQSSGQNYPCPKCRNYLRFIHQYNQWWCDSCRIYPYSERPEPVKGPPCPHCKNPTYFLQEHNKLWCNMCRKFPFGSQGSMSLDYEHRNPHYGRSSRNSGIGISFGFGSSFGSDDDRHRDRNLRGPDGMTWFRMRDGRVRSTSNSPLGMGSSSRCKVRGDRIYVDGSPKYRIRGKRIVGL